MTGFYRDGYCRTGPEDTGLHTVCVEMTREFLDFSVLDGNDLVTPRPEWGFPGLEPGDRWCVCVTRWKSALATCLAINENEGAAVLAQLSREAARLCPF